MKKRDVLFAVLGALLTAFVLIALFKPRIKQWAASVNCKNQMSAIGFAARVWAGDNGGNRLPDNFLVMSNELGTPKILICPADKTHRPAQSWPAFTANDCSYEILRPGMSAADFTNAYFRCRIHGYLGFADGTVFDGKRRRPKWP